LKSRVLTRREIRLRGNAAAIRRYQAGAVFYIGQAQQLGRGVHVPEWHANEACCNPRPVDLHGASVCRGCVRENAYLIRDILVTGGLSDQVKDNMIDVRTA
jgi:hypothetical protein